MGPATRSTAKAVKSIAKSTSPTTFTTRPALEAKQKVTKPRNKQVKSTLNNIAKDAAASAVKEDNSSPVKSKPTNDDALANKKWSSWSAHASSTPYPSHHHPTPQECSAAHTVLHKLHSEAVATEFADPDTPETIANVLDAMIVAVLSQATSWSNAKRAMGGLRSAYGSLFAYDDILAGGDEKLQDALRPGGLHIRKAKIIMTILKQVKETNGSWDLNHLIELNDEEAMKQLITYKYIGSKSAFVVMGWCMKRNTFTVDTHCFRIAKLWGWTPKDATVEKTQQHLDALIPKEYKFDLHFLMIAHGRTCPVCRGGSKVSGLCDAQKEVKALLKEGESSK
ncbi:DNA glycosylase [Aureobasidium subglaciale]|nr:DNA glycosylase [Aureobasidium subglaciale]